MRSPLTVIESLNSAKLIESRIHQIGELVEQFSTRTTGDVGSPGGILGSLGSLDGEIDIFGRGLRYLGDNLSS